MNLINSNISAVSYGLPYISFRTDPKFDKYQMGWPEKISYRLVSISPTKLTKPLNQSFNVNNEIPTILFDNYLDSQKIVLHNLYNQTDISYPANLSDLRTISGTVTKNEQISPYAEVRLHDKLSGKIVKKCYADSNGAFTFPDVLSQREWYIVAFDSKGEMNSVILSGVKT